MNLRIFDSHAHYDSERYAEDRDSVLSQMPENGICAILNCASDVESAKMSIELSEKYPFIYAAVGVHPHEAEDVSDDYLSVLRELARHEKVVAIGEMGLDYHYDFSPREDQRRVLCEQIELAKELDLPVVLHDREAHGDMYEILEKYAPIKGVMHCFSGSVELMKQSVKLGLYIGLGGAVTFKNARVPVEVAEAVPLDRLLLETDAPYMTPVPYRSKRNDSKYIELVAEKIAEVRGISAEEVLHAAEENARRLFDL